MRPIRYILAGRPKFLTRNIALLAVLANAGQADARPAKPLPPPTGELRLDMSDPVIEVRIGSVPLRLRVGLEQKRLIELNPEAADQLAAHPPDRHFRFESGHDAEVGRVMLHEILAAAPIHINDRDMIVTVASHGRDCCEGVDGEIGIGLLPYATIRFVRAGAPVASRRTELLLEEDEERGPQASFALDRSTLFVQLSLTRPASVATASAGVLLARTYGGRLEGEARSIAAFDIDRPVSMLTLQRQAQLAGFAFRQIPVRIADFAGNLSFPADPAESGDIVVKRRVSQQRAWPVLLIGRDRLDACSEILFETSVHRLTLSCAEPAQ